MTTSLSYIQDIIDAHPIVVFMKGTPEQPYCGFSRTVVRILESLQAPFVGVDVLDHPSLRDDLKAFSQWPTFPQLYVHGEFVGGCDIARDLFTSGELASMIASGQRASA